MRAQQNTPLAYINYEKFATASLDLTSYSLQPAFFLVTTYSASLSTHQKQQSESIIDLLPVKDRQGQQSKDTLVGQGKTTNSTTRYNGFFFFV